MARWLKGRATLIITYFSCRLRSTVTRDTMPPWRWYHLLLWFKQCYTPFTVQKDVNKISWEIYWVIFLINFSIIFFSIRHTSCKFHQLTYDHATTARSAPTPTKIPAPLTHSHPFCYNLLINHATTMEEETTSLISYSLSPFP